MLLAIEPVTEKVEAAIVGGRRGRAAEHGAGRRERHLAGRDVGEGLVAVLAPRSSRR
jgi:hypothetical protein